MAGYFDDKCSSIIGEDSQPLGFCIAEKKLNMPTSYYAIFVMDNKVMMATYADPQCGAFTKLEPHPWFGQATIGACDPLQQMHRDLPIALKSRKLTVTTSATKPVASFSTGITTATYPSSLSCNDKNAIPSSIRSFYADQCFDGTQMNSLKRFCAANPSGSSLTIVNQNFLGPSSVSSCSPQFLNNSVQANASTSCRLEGLTYDQTFCFYDRTKVSVTQLVISLKNIQWDITSRAKTSMQNTNALLLAAQTVVLTILKSKYPSIDSKQISVVFLTGLAKDTNDRWGRRRLATADATNDASASVIITAPTSVISSAQQAQADVLSAVNSGSFETVFGAELIALVTGGIATNAIKTVSVAEVKTPINYPTSLPTAPPSSNGITINKAGAIAGSIIAFVCLCSGLLAYMRYRHFQQKKASLQIWTEHTPASTDGAVGAYVVSSPLDGKRGSMPPTTNLYDKRGSVLPLSNNPMNSPMGGRYSGHYTGNPEADNHAL